MIYSLLEVIKLIEDIGGKTVDADAVPGVA